MTKDEELAEYKKNVGKLCECYVTHNLNTRQDEITASVCCPIHSPLPYELSAKTNVSRKESFMIKPTVGRIVLYHPAFVSDSGTNERTLPAVVCFVHSDTMVNLAVFDENGNHSSAGSVFLFQGEGERPASAYAEWMPYQKAVASGEIPPTVHAK